MLCCAPVICTTPRMANGEWALHHPAQSGSVFPVGGLCSIHSIHRIHIYSAAGAHLFYYFFSISLTGGGDPFDPCKCEEALGLFVYGTIQYNTLVVSCRRSVLLYFVSNRSTFVLASVRDRPHGTVDNFQSILERLYRRSLHVCTYSVRTPYSVHR